MAASKVTGKKSEVKIIYQPTESKKSQQLELIERLCRELEIERELLNKALAAHVSYSTQLVTKKTQ